MQIFSEKIFYALLIFFTGIVSTILIAKISKIFFKRITNRTKTDFDDFIFESINSTIKPIGILLSTYLTIDYFSVSDITFVSVLLNIKKLLILIIIIKALNKILIRLLSEATSKINDDSLSSMISSLTPLTKAFTWTIGSIFYLQNIDVLVMNKDGAKETTENIS